MFTKKSLPITLALVLLIALGTLGLGYGFWSESLQINGTVSTGNLDVAFVATGPATEYDPGDAATCVFAIDPNGNSMQVTIEGAYPWYECNIPVSVVNNGTVPVNFSGPTAVSLPPWLGLQLASISTTLAPGGTLAFQGSGLSFAVAETAPEGAPAVTFHLEFFAEQVH